MDTLAEDWVPAGDAVLNNKAYNPAHLTTEGNAYYGERTAQVIAKALGIKAS